MLKCYFDLRTFLSLYYIILYYKKIKLLLLFKYIDNDEYEWRISKLKYSNGNYGWETVAQKVIRIIFILVFGLWVFYASTILDGAMGRVPCLLNHNDRVQIKCIHTYMYIYTLYKLYWLDIGPKGVSRRFHRDCTWRPI